MSRTIRDSLLDTRTARIRLQPSPKPYYRAIEEGLHLGYRKPRGRKGKPAIAGKWVMRRYIGDGAYKVENIASADDFSDADGVLILNFSQAQAKARTINVQTAHEAAGIAPMTVAVVLENYVQWLEQHKASGTRVRSQVACNIEPELGSILAAKLTSEKIEKWHADLAAKPACFRLNLKGVRKVRVDETDEGKRKRKVTANRSLSILKAALNRAFRQGKISSDNAWRRVEAFEGVEAARVRFLTIDECNRFLRVGEKDFRELAEGALQSGARMGELARMDVNDFDLFSGTLHVQRSKTSRGRHIELTEEGIAFFIRQTAGRHRDEPMFLRHGERRWNATEQDRPNRAACTAANLEEYANFHALRHTWASHAVMNGVSLIVVAKNLGHSTTRMVEKHYGHLSAGFVRSEIRSRGPRYAPPASNVHSLDQERAKQRDAAAAAPVGAAPATAGTNTAIA